MNLTGGWLNDEDIDAESEEWQYLHAESEEWEYYGCEMESDMFYCDTCDREFYDEGAYEKHTSEHRVCNLDGCTFTAHEKVIEKHVRMQHATGLYDKIRNINTPEDIAKWVEDRKMRYPSKENIVKRQQEVEERWKRGERISASDNRFGRDKFRLQKNKLEKNIPRTRQMPQRRKKRADKKISLINEKHDWNGNMFPFRGTSSLEAEAENDRSEYEDDEWEQTPPGGTVVRLNNALSGLMGAYASDSASDEETPKMGIANNKVVRVTQVAPQIHQEMTTYQTNQSDNEPPDEIKTQKIAIDSSIPNQSTRCKRKVAVKKSARKKKKVPHFRQRNPNQMNRESSVADTTKQREFSYNFATRKVTLLEKLLQSEIRHERNVILQCVRYIVSRNFFKS